MQAWVHIRWGEPPELSHQDLQLSASEIKWSKYKTTAVILARWEKRNERGQNDDDCKAVTMMMMMMMMTIWQCEYFYLRRCSALMINREFWCPGRAKVLNWHLNITIVISYQNQRCCHPNVIQMSPSLHSSSTPVCSTCSLGCERGEVPSN